VFAGADPLRGFGRRDVHRGSVDVTVLAHREMTHEVLLFVSLGPDGIVLGGSPQMGTLPPSLLQLPLCGFESSLGPFEFSNHVPKSADHCKWSSVGGGGAKLPSGFLRPSEAAVNRLGKLDGRVGQTKARSAGVRGVLLVRALLGFVLLRRSGLQHGLRRGRRELRGGGLRLAVPDLAGGGDLRLREVVRGLLLLRDRPLVGGQEAHQPGVMALAEGPQVAARLHEAAAEAERGLGDDSDRLFGLDGHDHRDFGLGRHDGLGSGLHDGGDRETEGVEDLGLLAGGAGGLGGALGGLGGHGMISFVLG